MIEVIFLYVILQIKHMFADYILQFDYMLHEKISYGHVGGIHHSMIHGLGTWALFWAGGSSLAFWLALTDFLSHYHIDWGCSKIKNIRISLGVEQFLHNVTYTILIAWSLGIFYLEM